MTDEALPIVLAKGQEIGAAQHLSNAFGVAFGAAAKAAEIAPLVDEDLLRHLHLKLHHCYVAARRGRGFFGTVLNVLTGGDPDYVEMSAHHLRQALAVIGADAGGKLEVRQTYLLRKDVARQVHDLLGVLLGVAPDVLRKGLD